MRYLTLIITISSLLILFAGCSGSSAISVQPDNANIPQTDYVTSETNLLYSGTFEIDMDTMAISQNDDRQSEYVYDITGFLPDKCPGGCFRFAIVDVVGTVLEIELTLENPLDIQAYDLRVEYLELFGKTVLNPDSYTDFLGTPISDVFPFTAFMKENADRAFPLGPGGIDTETLFLDFPPGAGASVNYAITAHLPGQTPEPYEMSDMTQTGELTEDGGLATISCKVDDHQGDISGVFLNSIPFTGAPVQLQEDPLNPGYYEVEISNTQGAAIGDYQQLMMALSPNPQNISIYNYVQITISEIAGGYHWEFDDFLTFVTPSPPMNPPSEDFDVLSPALCEEYDGNLGMMLAANDILDLNPGLSFLSAKYRSSDDGATYTYLGMPEYGGSTGWATDKCKIFPSATAVAYGTYSWGSNYGYIAPLVSGAMHRGFSAGRPAYNMESLVDIHGWVYCLSDSSSAVTIKHSPNQLFTGDENWWSYTEYTITSGNILSHVRSIDLGDNEDIFLAVFNTDKTVISLCRNTDFNPANTWDDSTIVFDGSADYVEVRDPSLHVEPGNICHIVYTRRVSGSEAYQLVYTSDDDSFDNPVEVVIREQVVPFNDATIGYGHPLGLDVVTVSYESNDELFLISSFDGGITFGEPELVSPVGSSNRDPDMLIDADDGHLHMVWAYLDGTNHDIGRRNAVLVED